MDIIINGHLKTETPLTYTAPNLEGLPTIGGQPYLPSSAIRGKLRRHMRDYIVDATGKKLNFLDFYFLSVGGLNNEGKGKASKESKEEEENSAGENLESQAIDYAMAAQKINPLISIFGCGPGSPVAIASKLIVSHAIAVGDPLKVKCRIEPCRTDDARVSPAETYELVSEDFFEEYHRQSTLQRRGSELKKQKDDLHKRIKKASSAEEAQAIREEIKKIDEELNKKPVSISNPALGYDAIAPGTNLAVFMRMQRASDVEIALLMKAFERLAFNPVFGGRKAAGNGLVSGEFVVSTCERPGQPIKNVGTFGWDAFSLSLTATEKAKEWLEKPIDFGVLDFSYEALRKAVK
ncbi:RAMP superfamily CRISPR-associated protein [Sulfuricystis multivorans]|uniref:RAMP superfamily CRISPR-associated protein n=1 Tax=Sulfuricystis multivorans TaxID=2211108 RepID=UPI000F830CBB|nr:RAMP superfamily CRISPR-associated protein [Sulfuricystis multivorans]